MTTLSRRALLQLAGLAALPSLARADSAPEDWDEFLHEQAAQRPPSLFRADERALVAAMADAIMVPARTAATTEPPMSSTPHDSGLERHAFVQLVDPGGKPRCSSAMTFAPSWACDGVPPAMA